MRPAIVLNRNGPYRKQPHGKSATVAGCGIRGRTRTPVNPQVRPAGDFPATATAGVQAMGRGGPAAGAAYRNLAKIAAIACICPLEAAFHNF